MKLLVLMYHRARSGQHGNSPGMLNEQFAHIAGSYANVVPGEPLSSDRLNVCLTFDDAYFDFFVHVFPLLKRHHLRAVLAVPPLYVREAVTSDWETRLNIATDEAFAYAARGGFCTWSELRQMVESGLVTVAAHGFSHRRLDTGDADLSAEIDSPQSLLAKRLERPVDSFVFPFGRYSRPALHRARGRYRHVFRIGGALNRNWHGRVLYRIDADEMRDPRALFAPQRLASYRARFFWNRLRGR